MRRAQVLTTLAFGLAILASTFPGTTQEILLRATPHTTTGSSTGTPVGPTTPSGPLSVTSPGDSVLSATQEWNLRFGVGGGTAPYGFVAIGAPAGIVASSDGRLTGLVEPDVYAGIRMRVTDADGGDIVSQPITVTVGGPGLLASTPASVSGLDVVAPRLRGTSQTVTFRNSGDRPVSLPVMTVTGQFEVASDETGSNTCGSTLRRVETCQVKVRATAPANGQAGPISGTLGGSVQLAGNVVVPGLSIRTADLPEARVGTAFRYEMGPLLTRTGIPEGDAIAWSGGSLPPGLSVEPGTGVVSGNPTTRSQPSGAPFEIVATHADATGRQTFTLLVAGRALSGVTQISSGSYHTCAVVSGAAKCWGHNGDGQLGNGTTDPSTVPVQVSGLGSGVTSVSAGQFHSCAVVGGSARCWGAGTDGKLGNGGTSPSRTPVQVSGLTTRVTEIVAARNHSCAIVDGAAKCWGNNLFGSLGNGKANGSSVPEQVSSATAGASSIAAGLYHSCAVVSGAAKCWGGNGDGQLGNGGTASTSVPVQVSGLTTGVTRVAAGDHHSCAVVSGEARCWGFGGSGQVGDGSTLHRTTPVPVSGLGASVTDIATGRIHSCAVASGSVRCWGDNGSGRLGDGTETGRTTPVVVSDISSASKVSLGEEHSCATTTSGEVRCWGFAGNGRLGDGTTASHRTPATVLAE